MKLETVDELIQVLDSKSDVWSTLRQITQSEIQEEAFYICDVGDLVHKYKNWMNLMPRVQIYYAVKCNDNRTVLAVLAALGCGFDCASKEEIRQILSLGVHPKRIIFANPNRPISHIQYAAKVGVSLLTFDNEMELHKIKKFYPTANMVIRIKYDDLDAKYIFGKKFGCDPETEAPQLLKLARSLNINVVGVSFHIGSSSRTASIYERAIGACRQVFKVAASLGYQFKLLDIGGGYPGEHGTSIEEIGKYVNAGIDKHFSDLSIKIIAEPGRYCVSSAFTLATNIHSIRSIEKEELNTGLNTKTQMYYVNASVYGALISVIFDDKYTPQALISRKDAKYYNSIVWGPTCDGCDMLAEDVRLPEMKLGDWIIFEDAGAYTLSISSKFNGFPSPKVHAVVDKSNWKLLKDNYPLSNDWFVLGNTPANLRTGLDDDLTEEYEVRTHLAITV